LSIGTVASTGTVFLPDYIKAYHEKYPRIRFSLHEGDSQEIAERLNNSIIEIGIIRMPFDIDSFNSIKLPAEPMVAVIPAGIKELSEEKQKPIRMAQLENKPLMMHYRHESIISDTCSNYGFLPSVLCLGNDVRSLIIMACKGIGIALVPETAADYLSSTDVCCRKISEPSIELSAAIIWPLKKHISTAAKRFLELTEPTRG
ncbi:MAG: LysR family transcriptional regulator substrate-binding protein, partial [Clostridiales bacterium]|nr:LysR family transcriptional regulator substrate-binding protein [Clostridiales bacterium]